MRAPENRAEKFFTYFLPLLALLAAVTQDFVDWFASAFLPVLVTLFVFIVIIMFFYAIVKAPLDVLRKGLSVLALAVLTAQTEFYTELFKTFWSLLGAVLFILLPLLLILLLYKSFLALVRAR
jgi:hypothetical protein